MKRRGTAGYTIVEVMVVLAVTGTLFLSVVLMLSGRQAAAQFTQALRDYESKLQTVIAEVSSGYYETGTYDCSVAGANPIISNVAPPFNAPGTNQGCVFLGKIITSGTAQNDIFTLIGRQLGATTGADVELLTEARPIVVSRSLLSPTPVDITQSYVYKYGINIKNVYIIGGTTSIGGFGFITELGGGASAISPVTGSRGVLLYNLRSTTAPNVLPRFNNANGINTTLNLQENNLGVRICFWDGGTRRGEITVGADASQTATVVKEGDGISTECKNA